MCAIGEKCAFSASHYILLSECLFGGAVGWSRGLLTAPRPNPLTQIPTRLRFSETMRKLRKIVLFIPYFLSLIEADGLENKYYEKNEKDRRKGLEFRVVLTVPIERYHPYC